MSAWREAIVVADEAAVNTSRAEDTNLGIEQLQGSVGQADDRMRRWAGKIAVLMPLAEGRT